VTPVETMTTALDLLGSMLPQATGTGTGGETIQTEEQFLFLALPPLWVLGLVILPATIAFSWWCYGGLKRLDRKTRITLAALRGLAIAICLVVLFQPAWETKRYTQRRTQIHVLVDDSASMGRRDTYPDDQTRAQRLEDAANVSDLATRTRAQLVSDVLGKPGGLVEKLGEEYDVRLFRFVRKPTPIRDFGELRARGPRTPIGDALDLHLGSAGAADVDAVLLVSDGRSNSGLPPEEVAAKYRSADLPIFTIGVGDPNPPRNVRLIGPPGPAEALREEEVAFDVTLDPESLAGETVTVSLEGSRDGEPFTRLDVKDAVLGDDHVPVKVRLFHAFELAGDWTLRFKVAELPEETSHEDNTVTRFLRVDDEKIRVLFLDDLPRWEYRYVKNALLRVDKSIVAQVYLFDASGTFIQEHSDGLPPLRDLPRTREELFQYHVILIGDVPPERIGATEDEVDRWLELLVDFVEFGGGLGVSFGDRAMPERYRGTALEDLLPVVLEDPAVVREARNNRDETFVPQLENAEYPQDIVQLRRDPDLNEQLWEEGFAPLTVFYPVRQARPGAQVLLRHPTAENRFGKRVLAATTYYPRGNTFFLATDETWRWRFPYGEKWHDRFWRNVVRFLASGRLRRRDDRIDLRIDKASIETGEQVLVTLQVEDEEFEPSRAEEYPVFLRGLDGEVERRLLRTVPGELGSYRGRFALEEPGVYSFLVFANDNPADRMLAREDVFVEIPDRELAESSQDRAALEAIAAASKNGRYVFLADADELRDELAGRRPFEQEIDSQTDEAWDSIWSLLAVLVVLGAEWTLRKRARLV
jgi:uncharacterized membrane protein